MTEQEAMAYLGLTARTLRNHRRQGKLPYREVKGKTRPVIEYERADLERLKADLDRRRKRSKKPREVKPALPRVTFGLPPAEYNQLVSEATRYGMSPSEYARRLAREGMESNFQQEATELRGELAKANAEIRKMRKEFTLAFEAILEFAGLAPEDAKKWVTDNLR